MPFANTNKTNEYMYLKYYINNEKLTKACSQYIVTKGFLHQGLSHEEMQEKIKEYKIQYALRKKEKNEKETKLEAKRRQMFIYG